MTIRTPFEAHVIDQFLTQGWCLAIDRDRILVGWGEWHESSEPPANLSADSDICAVYAPDFYLRENRAWRWTNHWDLLRRDRFASLVLAGVEALVNRSIAGTQSGAESIYKTNKFQWVEPSFEKFEKAWGEIQVGFQERGLKKAVPVVFSETAPDFDRGRLAQALRSLVNQGSALYPYGMWTVDSGLLGATPEILFTGGRETLETMALAGTRKKSEVFDAIALMRDPKERYEHQLVVDDLKDRLARVGDVVIGSTETLELPTMYHLCTKFRVRLARPLNFEERVRLLHPTPALGVAPRALGIPEMNRWDDAEIRGRFGAPFGVYLKTRDEEHFHSVVAIRNIQWNPRRVLLGTGCGVVSESNLQSEWGELALKRDSVKRVLDL